MLTPIQITRLLNKLIELTTNIEFTKPFIENAIDNNVSVDIPFQSGVTLTKKDFSLMFNAEDSKETVEWINYLLVRVYLDPKFPRGFLFIHKVVMTAGAHNDAIAVTLTPESRINMQDIKALTQYFQRFHIVARELQKLLIKPYKQDEIEITSVPKKALETRFNKQKTFALEFRQASGSHQFPIKLYAEYLKKTQDDKLINEQGPGTGKTSLHRAVAEKIYDKAELLLQAGVDVTIKDAEGRTAYDIAKAHLDYDKDSIRKLKFNELFYWLEHWQTSLTHSQDAELKEKDPILQELDAFLAKPRDSSTSYDAKTIAKKLFDYLDENRSFSTAKQCLAFCYKILAIIYVDRRVDEVGYSPLNEEIDLEIKLYEICHQKEFLLLSDYLIIIKHRLEIYFLEGYTHPAKFNQDKRSWFGELCIKRPDEKLWEKQQQLELLLLEHKQSEVQSSSEKIVMDAIPKMPVVNDAQTADNKSEEDLAVNLRKASADPNVSIPDYLKLLVKAKYEKVIDQVGPKTRMTALHQAAEKKQFEKVHLLLHTGADAEMTDYNGLSPYHLALMYFPSEQPELALLREAEFHSFLQKWTEVLATCWNNKNKNDLANSNKDKHDLQTTLKEIRKFYKKSTQTKEEVERLANTLFHLFNERKISTAAGELIRFCHALNKMNFIEKSAEAANSIAIPLVGPPRSIVDIEIATYKKCLQERMISENQCLRIIQTRLSFYQMESVIDRKLGRGRIKQDGYYYTQLLIFTKNLYKEYSASRRSLENVEPEEKRAEPKLATLKMF